VGTSGSKQKGTGDLIMALIIWGLIVSVVLILPVFVLEASGQLPKWLEVLALPIVFLSLIPVAWRYYPRGQGTDEGTATPPPSSSEPSKTGSNLDELEMLASLRDKGIITQEEFDAKKEQLLDL
jgi:hypothetical protein